VSVIRQNAQGKQLSNSAHHKPVNGLAMSPHRPEINRRPSIKLKPDPIDKPRQRSPRVISDLAFLSDYRIENPLVDRASDEMLFEHRARTMRVAVSSFSRCVFYLDRDDNADEHD